MSYLVQTKLKLHGEIISETVGGGGGTGTLGVFTAAKRANRRLLIYNKINILLLSYRKTNK